MFAQTTLSLGSNFLRILLLLPYLGARDLSIDEWLEEWLEALVNSRRKRWRPPWVIPPRSQLEQVRIPFSPFIEYPPEEHEDVKEGPQETRPNEDQWAAEIAVAEAARKPEWTVLMMSSGFDYDRCPHSKDVYKDTSI